MNPITTIHAIGARVHVVDVNGRVQHYGAVTGHFVGQSNSGPALFYVVTLDSGFYNEARDTWVLALTVHADNVRDGVARCPDCSDVLTDRGQARGDFRYCDSCDREVVID